MAAATAVFRSGNTTSVSETGGLDHVLGSIDSDAVDGDLDGISVEGQTLLLDIMEGEVVGLVVGVVARQGGLQLERDLVAEIVISGVLPLGGTTSGVVDVLDLLLKGGHVALRADNHVADNLGDVQSAGVGGIAAHGAILVLDEVVARNSGVGRLVLSQRGDWSAGEVGEHLDDVKLLLVGLAFDVHVGELLQLVGGHLGVRSLGTVHAVLDVGKHLAVEITGEDLVHLVGVTLVLGISREADGVGGRRGSSLPLHSGCGGGTGETGDGHCRGGCHSDEALENLVHVSSFS